MHSEKSQAFNTSGQIWYTIKNERKVLHFVDITVTLKGDSNTEIKIHNGIKEKNGLLKFCAPLCAINHIRQSDPETLKNEIAAINYAYSLCIMLNKKRDNFQEKHELTKGITMINVGQEAERIKLNKALSCIYSDIEIKKTIKENKNDNAAWCLESAIDCINDCLGLDLAEIDNENFHKNILNYFNKNKETFIT